VQLLHIGGTWQEGISTYDVLSPWDSALVGTVASASRLQAEAAVSAAVAAPALPAHVRASVLLEVAQAIEERNEEFARVIAAEAGKPIASARLEASRAVTTFRLSAGEAQRLRGEAVPMDAVIAGEGMLAMTIPQPVGVVAAITPFNFPLNLVVHKLGPALAAGCPVVLKPSERTPLTSGLLVDTLVRAGLPPGWVNLVTGDPAVVVDAWLQDPRVALVNFTGSTGIGYSLRERSPHKRHILELGSNTAMVVSRHADVDAAVRAAIVSGFIFSGQSCVSLQRVYAAREIVADFTDRLAVAADKLISGDPMDEKTEVGPLITSDAVARVQGWIKEAVGMGATVRAGANLENGVLRPTILTDVPDQACLIREEVFGPVVSVNTVEDVAEGARQVNRSHLGLNSSIFTNDVREALAFAKVAEVGTVLVNVPPGFRADHMPYGGVKQSGEGREGVAYAVAAMLSSKLLVLDATQPL
jgi:acyl-CoA reductase-like NAD-dependent aldehyde dehydrogenase